MCSSLTNGVFHVSMQLFAVLDILSISAAAVDCTSQTIAPFSVTDSWSRLLKILQQLLERELEMGGECGVYLTEVFASSSTTVSERAESLSGVHTALPRLSGAMNRLISAADRDEIKSIFEALHKHVCT